MVWRNVGRPFLPSGPSSVTDRPHNGSTTRWGHNLKTRLATIGPKLQLTDPKFPIAKQNFWKITDQHIFHHRHFSITHHTTKTLMQFPSTQKTDSNSSTLFKALAFQITQTNSLGRNRRSRCDEVCPIKPATRRHSADCFVPVYQHADIGPSTDWLTVTRWRMAVAARAKWSLPTCAAQVH